MKFLKWFLIVIAVLALIIFLLYEHYKPVYHTPKLNPHPKYFLTIEGTVAPEFRGVGHLVFMAQYVTTKDPCFHETNPLAGMIEGEGRTKYYWITPDKNNHYKIKIPIDKYEPGICGWIPWTVSNNMVPKKYNDKANEFALVSISNTASQALNPKEITYTCDEPYLLNCLISVKKNKSPLLIIKTDQSYTLIVNIKYKQHIKEKFRAEH